MRRSRKFADFDLIIKYVKVHCTYLLVNNNKKLAKCESGDRQRSVSNRVPFLPFGYGTLKKYLNVTLLCLSFLKLMCVSLAQWLDRFEQKMCCYCPGKVLYNLE